MEIRERAEGAVPVLELVGRMVVDEDSSDERVQDRVAELMSGGHRHLILNLAHVQQVDTSGLTALVGAHVKVARCGGRLGLVEPPARLRELLHRTRLDTLFEIWDLEQDALKEIGPELSTGP